MHTVYRWVEEITVLVLFTDEGMAALGGVTEAEMQTKLSTAFYDNEFSCPKFRHFPRC